MEISRKKHTTRNLLFVFLLVIASCDSKKSQDKNPLLFWLLRPSLGLFGDSISAFWPAESMLYPFISTKIAFSIRNSKSILEAAIEDKGKYNACIYNGGVNDFLGNFAPDDSLISETVDNQLKTIEVLKSKCGNILVINTWMVEKPWPEIAVIKLNIKMKERITMVGRLDSELFINKGMLLDGGHLTEDGYRILSKHTLEYFRFFYPILSLFTSPP